MILTAEAFVSVYLDVMAALLIFGILLLPDRKRIKSETEGELFYGLCINTLIIAICSTVCYALHFQTFQGVYYIELLSKTILELALLSLVYQWMMYVDLSCMPAETSSYEGTRSFSFPLQPLQSFLS